MRRRSRRPSCSRPASTSLTSILQITLSTAGSGTRTNRVPGPQVSLSRLQGKPWAKALRFESVMCPWRQGCSGLQESCHGLKGQGTTTTRAAYQVRRPRKAACERWSFGIFSNTAAVGATSAETGAIKANAVETSAARAQCCCSCDWGGEGPAGPASSSAASSSGASR